MLRQLGQPICLFAEDIAFRRERLKEQVMKYTTSNLELPEFVDLNNRGVLNNTSGKIFKSTSITTTG